MATSTENRTTDRTNYPIATEFAYVVAVTVGFSLWLRVGSRVASRALSSHPPSDGGGLLVDGLLYSVSILAGLALFAGAYAARRDIEVGLSLPSSNDRELVGVALLLPAALVGLTKLVGDFTGTSYGSLTKTAYASNAPIEPFLILTGLGLFVGVPGYLLLCQIVVQGSFRRVVGGEVAVVLTTVLAGFLLIDSSGGPSPIPDRGKVAGAVVFALAVGLALYASEHADRRWVLAFSYFPVILFVAVAVVSGIAAVDSVAGVLYTVTQVTVLGLAAFVYERTESLLVPALGYLSLLLTSNLVVFVFEAGTQSW